MATIRAFCHCPGANKTRTSCFPAERIVGPLHGIRNLVKSLERYVSPIHLVLRFNMTRISSPFHLIGHTKLNGALEIPKYLLLHHSMEPLAFIPSSQPTKRLVLPPLLVPMMMCLPRATTRTLRRPCLSISLPNGSNVQSEAALDMEAFLLASLTSLEPLASIKVVPYIFTPSKRKQASFHELTHSRTHPRTHLR